MDDGNSIGNDKTISPDDAGKETNASLNPGDSLGQYKILRLLGRGGMGEVYEVEHTVLRKRYALKLLPSEFVNRSDSLTRFKQEAEVMANLDHPNILKVDEFGETNGRYWLRMEQANGGRCQTSAPTGRPHRSPGLSGSATLGRDQGKELCPEGAPQQSTIVRSLADYVEASGGKLSPDEAQAIFTQILEGLAHAHEHGVVHRDLKPANILIFSDSDGNATFKIADFGLVRMVGEEWVRSQADQSIRLSMSMGQMTTEMPEAAGSSTRSLIGTYEYMSPEQKRSEDATAASDVYAVGVMMYRLLTGSVQLGRKSVSQLAPGVSGDWDSLIDRAVDDFLEDRLPNALVMLSSFKECDSGQAERGAEKEFRGTMKETEVSGEHENNDVNTLSKCQQGESQERDYRFSVGLGFFIGAIIGMIVIGVETERDFETTFFGALVSGIIGMLVGRVFGGSNQPHYKSSSEVLQVDKKEKSFAVLAYLIFFLPLLTTPESKFSRFHANQALLLLITWLAINVVGSIIPLVGWFIIIPLGIIFCLVLFIKGIINAANGRAKRLPLIGGYDIIK